MATSDSESDSVVIVSDAEDALPDVLRLFANDDDEEGIRRGRKRGRSSDGGSGSGSGGGKWNQAQLTSTAVPWRGSGQSEYSTLPSRNALLRLHEEILEFVSMMRPTAGEEHSANATLERIVHVVEATFPGAEVFVFGSRATGMALPDADWDICVKNVTSSSSSLHRLGDAISDAGFATQLQVIDKARVPIVKYIDGESALAVDISLEQDTGADSTRFVKEAMSAWPMLRPLVLVLKYYLKQRGLAETYSGGIGSFLLCVMALRSLQLLRDMSAQASTALLKHHPQDTEGKHKSQQWSRQLTKHGQVPMTSIMNLGAAMLLFLELFGVKLNYVDVAFSVRGAGAFFKKRSSKLWNKSTKYDGLCVESPVDTASDLGGGAWNTFRYKSSFQSSFMQLRAAMSAFHEGASPASRPKRRNKGGLGGQQGRPPVAGSVSTLLACIVPPDSYLRARAEMLSAIPPGQRYAYSDSDAAAGAASLTGAAGAIAPVPTSVLLHITPAGELQVVLPTSDTVASSAGQRGVFNPDMRRHGRAGLGYSPDSGSGSGSDSGSDSDDDSQATELDNGGFESDGGSQGAAAAASPAAAAAGEGGGEDGYDTSEEAAPKALQGRSLRKPRLLHHIMTQKHCRPEAQEAAMALTSWF